MKLDSKIFVAGGCGLVGSAIIGHLKKKGYSNILSPSHKELDLMDQQAVNLYFAKKKPEIVFLAAAKVGGIVANSTYPADFIYQNLMIQNSLIHQSYLHGVKKLLFLGSSCIYPRDCDQPIREEYLMTGPLEPSNSPYAVAKIAGIEMCWAYNRQYNTLFLPVMPTNLYGPNDNFDYETSHVLPALIRKFHEAKVNNLDSVSVWGSGMPRREFLHVNDLARACVFLMETDAATKLDMKKPLINIGTGKDLSIAELVLLVKQVVGFNGDIIYDRSKPDGTPQKLLDVSILTSLGWKAHVSLKDGIHTTYKWFLENY